MSSGNRHHSIKINAVLNVIRTVMGIVFPLITYPYISRILGVEALGNCDFSTSIISYFVLFAGLGVSNYAIREAPKYREQPQLISDFTSEVFSINVISMLISYVALFVAMIAIPKFHDYRYTVLILSVQMLFNTVGVPWLCNIYEDFLVITIRTLMVQLVSLVSIFIFVKSPQDLNAYAAITALASSGANIFNFFYARKNYTKFHFTFACNIKEHLKPILVLFSTSLMIVIYVSSDTTMLGFFTTDYQVGLYGTAVKIYTLIKNILSAIIVVMIPRFSLLLNTDGGKSRAETLLSKSMNALTLLMIPMMTGLYILAEDIILFIAGESYLAGTKSLQILSIAVMFSLYAYMFIHCILVPLKKENLVFKITLISALSNVGLNFIFIPLWGINGAAITTAIAEFIVFIMTYYHARKEINFVNFKNNFIMSVIGSACIVLVVCLLKNYLNAGLARLLISIILSVVVYAAVLIVMRNEIIFEGIKSVKGILSGKINRKQ